MECKQYIIARKDLKMPPGKLAAQVSHASMGAITQYFRPLSRESENGELLQRSLVLDTLHAPNIHSWLSGSFTKVILQVNSEKELLDLDRRLRELCLDPVLIKDNGRTCFDGVPTYTCLGLPPYIDMSLHLGHLKLY